MHFITHSTSNRYFRLPDAAGKPGTRIQARELIDSNRIGQMKRCNRLQVRYANMGRLNLPRYGWVFATVVYNPKRYPQKFLLVTNNLAANGPSVIEKYQKRWGGGDDSSCQTEIWTRTVSHAALQWDLRSCLPDDARLSAPFVDTVSLSLESKHGTIWCIGCFMNVWFKRLAKHMSDQRMGLEVVSRVL